LDRVVRDVTLEKTKRSKGRLERCVDATLKKSHAVRRESLERFVSVSIFEKKRSGPKIKLGARRLHDSEEHPSGAKTRLGARCVVFLIKRRKPKKNLGSNRLRRAVERQSLERDLFMISSRLRDFINLAKFERNVAVRHKTISRSYSRRVLGI
jgi:hypothetical protein